MRIISGFLGGRRFYPKGKFPNVRPTSDKTREAVFNILEHRFDLSKVRFLDLFAGFGGMSYEMASRGCRDITAVESNPRCVAFIRKTASDFGIDDSIRVIPMKVEDFIRMHHQPYDIIFVDPPYRYTGTTALIRNILDKPLLTHGGILIVEHARGSYFEHLPHYAFHKRYGRTLLSVFQYRPPTEEE